MKVAGNWPYLYRALDKCGHTIDFYLSVRRNAKAAQQFLGKALNKLKFWQMPNTLSTDKASSHAVAIAELKKQGKLSAEANHRQVKYLNNVIECDHGNLKRIINPLLGFKSMQTAYATIKGIATIRALRKGQASPWYYGHPLGEGRLVKRVFGF